MSFAPSIKKSARRFWLAALAVIVLSMFMAPTAGAAPAEPVFNQLVNQNGKWVKQTQVKPGDTVGFLMVYHNQAKTSQRIVLKETIPAKTSLAPSTTYLYNPANVKGIKQTETVTTVGLDSGLLKPSETAFVMLQAVMPPASKLACGDSTLIVHGLAAVMGTTKVYTSSSRVTLHKDCAAPTAYRCYGLAVRVVQGRQVMIYDFKYASPNTSDLTYVAVNWGDGTPIRRAVTEADQHHVYAIDKTYTVTTIAHFTVDGSEFTRRCSTTVKVATASTTPPATPTTPTTTPTTPTRPQVQPAQAVQDDTDTDTATDEDATPKTLVNTGAGSVWGIAAVVAVLATTLRFAVLRRASRQ